ncbi:uncharacterized protein LOC111706677 isoform X2 [Eurytemora carolleeae]|uniref:uncharacterized protein LOC111706677 isoform X2 n=1 Tax=Eurytemora carolleeae TaxID=1294199 RepID=UPI000C779F36|nr:uncharacterized protein LOC111706677 isoform X2 [Eurytemora carolleeae]|eukprot:XP_023335354.1 uncharacterized protein LOC111706677 isoform X2 [Eurytemora affinis]
MTRLMTLIGLLGVISSISAQTDAHVGRGQLSPPGAEDLLEVAGRLCTAVQYGMEHSNWFHYRNFGTWSYEGAMVTRGLWELQDTLPDLNLEPFLHKHLDFFLEEEDEFGYRILHNESLTYNDSSVVLPWIYSIGDNIGLFPVVYVDRLKYGTLQGGHTVEEDVYVISEVVEKYIYGYPWHLPDGTISRPITWMEEGFLDMRGGGVWVDDMHMGTALLIEYALISNDISHLVYAGHQLLLMSAILQDELGLMRHGYHFWTDHYSCCFWARGNGWALVAFTEFLSAADSMDLVTHDPDMYMRVMDLYNSHLGAILGRRGENGLWTNILTNNSTFFETSASAMFMMSLSRGYRNGWIYVDQDFTDTILQTWNSLLNNILQDGTVTNIIGGTGIKDNEEGYIYIDQVSRITRKGIYIYIY